jgi:hypothetical protein
MNENASEVNRKDVEVLAHRLWDERGRPAGSPEEDWFSAEHEFYRAEPFSAELPFSSVIMEPGEK